MHGDLAAPRAAWLALVVVALASASAAALAGAQTGAVPLAAAEAAARVAIAGIFGAGAEVQLSAPVLTLAPDAGQVVVAVPEPSSRTAGPVRFVLYGDADQTKRVGRLTARVDVRASHVRARQKVAARAAVTAADVEVAIGDIGRQPLAALPTLVMVTAATTRKALQAGEVITGLALVEAPLVASGQEVVTVARVAGLEIRGRAIAAQSGGLGQTVVVVNPDSRRRLRGRVVADALVEVLHGS